MPFVAHGPYAWFRGELTRLRTTAFVRRLEARPKARLIERALAAGARGIVFDITGKMGMGAVLTHALMILKVSERAGVAPYLRCTNTLYARSGGHSDWLADFLVQENGPAPPGAPVVGVRSHYEYELALGAPGDVTVAEAHRMFFDHFSFAPAVMEEADRFAAAHWGTGPVLGVHYRGTDKRTETPIIAFAAVVDVIRSHLETGSYAAIFLATDEPAFADHLAAIFPGVTILSYSRPEIERRHGVPIHFSEGDGYWKGIDALANMILLARTDLLIRTASYMSGWSAVINPDLPVIMLRDKEAHFPHFPDKELSRRTTPPVSPAQAA